MIMYRFNPMYVLFNLMRTALALMYMRTARYTYLRIPSPSQPLIPLWAVSRHLDEIGCACMQHAATGGMQHAAGGMHAACMQQGAHAVRWGESLETWVFKCQHPVGVRQHPVGVWVCGCTSAPCRCTWVMWVQHLIRWI